MERSSARPSQDPPGARGGGAPPTRDDPAVGGDDGQSMAPAGLTPDQLNEHHRKKAAGWLLADPFANLAVATVAAAMHLHWLSSFFPRRRHIADI
eukprot:4081343-Pyramimonas_sp.AAC.1